MEPVSFALSTAALVILGAVVAFLPSAVRGWRRPPGGSVFALLMRATLASFFLGALVLLSSFGAGLLGQTEWAVGLGIASVGLSLSLVLPLTYLSLVVCGLRSGAARAVPEASAGWSPRAQARGAGLSRNQAARRSRPSAVPTSGK